MENQKGSVRVKPLSLTDLSSAFIILGLGFSLAFLVFLIERVIHVAKTKHHQSDDNVTIMNLPKLRLVIPIKPKTIAAIKLKPSHVFLPISEATPSSNQQSTTGSKGSSKRTFKSISNKLALTQLTPKAYQKHEGIITKIRD